MAERDSKGRFVSDADDSDGADDASPQSSGRKSVDISNTPAPSIGPHTTFDTDTAAERLARHEQSDTDAMGLDKRRQVIGGRYSASFTRQAITYAIVVLIVAGAGIGLKLLADDLDQPPAQLEDQAPWTGSEQKPTPLQ